MEVWFPEAGLKVELLAEKEFVGMDLEVGGDLKVESVVDTAARAAVMEDSSEAVGVVEAVQEANKVVERGEVGEMVAGLAAVGTQVVS